MQGFKSQRRRRNTGMPNKPSNKRRLEKSDLPATAEVKMNKDDDLIGTSKINNFNITTLKYSPLERLTVPSILLFLWLENVKYYVNNVIFCHYGRQNSKGDPQ